jgi:membrane protease YdiL (CAAX protease family)
MSAEGQIARSGVGESTLEGPMSEGRTEQYYLAKILGIWTAAALPMAALAWVVAPLVAARLDGPLPLMRTLLALLTIGLIWQFVLVLLLVYRERGSLRWPILKDALWLQSPRSPTTGRVGGWLWLVLIPATLLFATEEFIPTLPPVASHDFAVFVGSEAGREFFSGNWIWFALNVVLAVFNAILGEELLFRGVLLPRMRGPSGASTGLPTASCSPSTTCTCRGRSR